MTDKTPKELYNERVQLWHDASKWNKPKRVLFNSYLYTWMYLDAGYRPIDAARDYDICEQCMIRIAENYKIDALNIGASGFRFPFGIFDVLGNHNIYDIGRNGEITGVFEDRLDADDYDALIENQPKIIYEKALFRQCPDLKNITPEQFAKNAYEYIRYKNAKTKADARLRDEYGVLVEQNMVAFGFAIENIFNAYRGIKGMSTDLRRNYAKVEEYCSKKDDEGINSFKERIAVDYGENKNYYDAFTGGLAHTALNMKHLEKLYLNTMTRFLNICEERNLSILINMEGSFLRFADFFNDYKKGTVNIMVESDDPYEIRKKAPTIAISGGMPVDIIGHESPETCVNYARRVIDDLGTDGGLVLMPNKMVSYPYDMNSDNLRAVAEFVSEYYIN